jgi:hypothetical protein
MVVELDGNLVYRLVVMKADQMVVLKVVRMDKLLEFLLVAWTVDLWGH